MGAIKYNRHALYDSIEISAHTGIKKDARPGISPACARLPARSGLESFQTQSQHFKQTAIQQKYLLNR
jgi:hypothetical protein